MAVKPLKLGLIDRVFVGLLFVVFGGIVLHAPLTVGFGVLFPGIDLLIKSWKEILLILASVLMLIVVYRHRQWRIFTSPLMLAVAGYALLHLLLLPLSFQGASSAVAGLFIDLRYVLFFVLVYVAVMLYPALRRPFLITFFVGAFVVAAFALLQVFVLPPDILKYIGYSNATIVPFLTVDENDAFIRINSTLRGPNPLGAYAAIVLIVSCAYWVKHQVTKKKLPIMPVSVIVIGSAVALWASYSRSALVAAAAGIAVILAVTVARKLSRQSWIAIAVLVVSLSIGLVAGRDSNFVSNVILHENPTTGAAINSNEGHIDSLQDGVYRMAIQPLGGGIGSTGSASLYGDEPLIIENQYLFIAHEVGWLGLVLFLVLFVMILRQLWHRRADWLALGVFASGIGMALIGLLLPVWVDDTVAIIWWGLAAIALATPKTFLTKPR
jgi:hypothetical protein